MWRIGVTSAMVFVLSLWVLSLTSLIARLDEHFNVCLRRGKLHAFYSPDSVYDAVKNEIYDVFNFQFGETGYLYPVPDVLYPPGYVTWTVHAETPYYDFQFIEIDYLFSLEFLRTRAWGFDKPILGTPDYFDHFYRDGYHLRIPMGWATVISVSLWALVWYRTRRYPAGHCQECNYDLARNKSGVCPECGEAVVGEVIT